VAKPKRIPKEVKAVLGEHRKRLERLVDRRSLPGIRKMLDEANGELTRRLKARIRAGKGDEFTAYQQRVALAQIRNSQAEIISRMHGEISDGTEEAAYEAVRGLVDDLGRLERHFRGAATPIPIEEASQFQGLVDGRRRSILRSTETSLARYGTDVVDGVEKEMSKSLLMGETTGEAIERVADFVDGSMWRAERIVRTEMAGAFNLTHRDAIEAAADEVEDLWMRWSEHVTDDDEEAMDDRVGTDSVAMHGQVAKPGDLFTVPYTAPTPGADGKTTVSISLAGQTFDAPPNRPNDRAVLEPWRPEWGVPAWVWRAGSRQWL
jgi:hypothetical protein